MDNKAPQSSLWASLLALSMAAAACIMACGGSDKRAKIPEETPESLEVLAEDPRRNEGAAGDAAEEEARAQRITGLPPATEPIRQDACGIPLAVSIEAMITPEGVVRIQEELVKKGFLPKNSYKRGHLEASTLAAILALQKQADLPLVGLPTYSTVEALGLAPSTVFTTGDANCEEGA
jgi:hypothetical protein